MIGGSEGCLETTIGGASGCWFGAFLGREGRPVGRTCGMDILRSFGSDSVIGDGLWGVGVVGLYTGLLGKYLGRSGVRRGGGGVLLVFQLFQGFWGEFPASKSMIRISGTKLCKVSRGFSVAVDTEVEIAHRLEMTHSIT